MIAFVPTAVRAVLFQKVVISCNFWESGRGGALFDARGEKGENVLDLRPWSALSTTAECIDGKQSETSFRLRFTAAQASLAGQEVEFGGDDGGCLSDSLL